VAGPIPYGAFKTQFMANPSVLVVEDNEPIRRGLVDTLKFAGFSVQQCDRGDEVLGALARESTSIVLLDLMLPGMDGFTVLQEIRRCHPRLPVIILSAKGAEEDRVKGLELGADDYVVKPFSPKELMARLEAVLRRSADRPLPDRIWRLGDRTIDFELREVVLPDGERRALSELEASIVRYLAGKAESVVNREELLQNVWGYASAGAETRTVDVHIGRLREKIEDDPSKPRFIITVRARGYMLSTNGFDSKSTGNS
jgi:DNA-binding response OmpR family regulator